MAGHARLQSFGLGGMEMLDQSYAVESLPERGEIGAELSGLIGADWLSDYDVDLDAAHRRMTLYRARAATATTCRGRARARRRRCGSTGGASCCSR